MTFNKFFPLSFFFSLSFLAIVSIFLFFPYFFTQAQSGGAFGCCLRGGFSSTLADLKSAHCQEVQEENNCLIGNGDIFLGGSCTENVLCNTGCCTRKDKTACNNMLWGACNRLNIQEGGTLMNLVRIYDPQPCADLSNCPSGEELTVSPPKGGTAIKVNLQVPISLGAGQVLKVAESLGQYISVVYKWLVSALSLLAVVMIMIAGLQWIVAAGNASKISEAKKKISDAIFGLMLAIMTFLILQFLNPNLLKVDVGLQVEKIVPVEQTKSADVNEQITEGGATPYLDCTINTQVDVSRYCQEVKSVERRIAGELKNVCVCTLIEDCQKVRRYNEVILDDSYCHRGETRPTETTEPSTGITCTINTMADVRNYCERVQFVTEPIVPGGEDFQDVCYCFLKPECQQPGREKVALNDSYCSESTTPTRETEPVAVGEWTYDSGIEEQLEDASPELRSLLSCMRSRLPSNVGRISSISDSRGMENCVSNRWTSSCHHALHSCHYGGNNCQGLSYAVDFGDGDPFSRNLELLRSAARLCEPNVGLLNEENHLHVSIGCANGCSCDCGL